ncbi:glycosyltransferase [Nocardioides sp. LMS-CY]|uniref:glycosyltransferase n=1 Tax=Nocardioides sp. (strain LMS-CY) TaxID=2840457 RepID=UPI001BFFF643|nr:glycosyltransferase [Nocardioides sp. LMS-CY]QWF21710.1 glycosyltransferase [Nocardioides sp. LMS-CY]
MFEIDDAIYLGYPGDSVKRAAQLRSRVTGAADAADLVTTTTELLAIDLRKLSASPVAVFAGPYPKPRPSNVVEREGLVWLGSPSTFSNTDVVRAAVRNEPSLSLCLVGAPTSGTPHPNISMVVWSPDAENEALARSRVGVMPQYSDRWSDRKAAYKVLEYLAAGLVPVATDCAPVRAALGPETEGLCFLVPPDSDAYAWRDIIEKANNFVPDDGWRAARERVASRLAPETFCAIVLGEE